MIDSEPYVIKPKVLFLVLNLIQFSIAFDIINRAHLLKGSVPLTFGTIRSPGFPLHLSKQLLLSVCHQCLNLFLTI